MTLLTTRILRGCWVTGIVAVVVGSLVPAQSPVIRLLARADLNDKAEHFTAYAVLAALPALERFRCRRLRTAVVFLVLLGGALELGQLFSPGRSCDWRDFLANSCGILAGVALVRSARLAFRPHFSSVLPANSSRPSPGPGTETP